MAEVLQTFQTLNITVTNSDTTYNWNLTGVTGSTLEIWVAFNNDQEEMKSIELTILPSQL